VPEELDAAKLTAAAPPGWRIRLVDSTDSTNADLRAAASTGDLAAGQVLVAEYQRAGRGRLDRRWESARGAGLTFSLVADPAPVPEGRWGWLPLLTGLAIVDAVRDVAAIGLRVKWPNDVLSTDGRKVAGVLSERVDTDGGPLAIVGIGINVDAQLDQLPVPTAGSLAVAGAGGVDRSALLAAVVSRFQTRLDAWRACAGDAESAGLADAYAAASVTLGANVAVELPGGAVASGQALRIAASGELVLRTVDGELTVAAGDVRELG